MLRAPCVSHPTANIKIKSGAVSINLPATIRKLSLTMLVFIVRVEQRILNDHRKKEQNVVFIL